MDIYEPDYEILVLGTLSYSLNMYVQGSVGLKLLGLSSSMLALLCVWVAKALTKLHGCADLSVL